MTLPLTLEMHQLVGVQMTLPLTLEFEQAR